MSKNCALILRRTNLSRHVLSVRGLSASRSSFTARYSSATTRQWSTPLAKSLAEAITTTGPISIANYMRQCLTSPEGGYYTTRASKDRDQFGKRGDFITSPEISQVFGELVGIWFVAEWMAQGKKSGGVQLVELGPGRGTLMDDVLRTISNFKPMAAAIDTIYLVEASPTLRETQKSLLSGPSPMQDHPCGKQCSSKRLPGVNVVWVEDVKFLPQGQPAFTVTNNVIQLILERIPESNKTPFIIAHEFFDALPIHAFQSVPQPARPSSSSSTIHRPVGITTSISSMPPPPAKPQNEWRELLVSPTPPPSVLKPPKTPGPEFQLTVSKTPTHHSRLLPALSPRYAALLPTAGSTIEISPEAQTTMTYLTELISGKPVRAPMRPSPITPSTSSSATPSRHQPPQSITTTKPHPTGAALLIDYGPTTTIPISTLRGIRSHALQSPFSSPGAVDLSTDVDFGALAETAVNASEDVEVHGPVEQAGWLESMGGRERTRMLVEKAGEEGVRERVEGGWKRLVDRGVNGMGVIYKVMAVVPATGGVRRPVGFGGGVE